MRRTEVQWESLISLEEGTGRMLVDMHNHIINVTSIRSSNGEDAIQIVKSAAADGITHIIVTPLYQQDEYLIYTPVLKHLVNKINDRLEKLSIPVTILEGMEIRFYEELVSDISNNIFPLAGSNKYIFISFPETSIPPSALQVFFDIQLRGYIPIIANAERNEEIRKNPEKLFSFVDRGTLVHVGAASILGMNGRKERKASLKLCKHSLVHFISSASCQLVGRSNLLKPAYDFLEKKFSSVAVDYFRKNAESIVSGKEIQIFAPFKFNGK